MNLPDTNLFRYTECNIAGDLCWLIQPEKMGVKWTDENDRFRSVIVRQSDHRVVSQGFKKFVNLNETPTFQPWDYSWPVEARHKLDGSLLLVSKHNGELVIRTRGTSSYHKMDNADDMEFLIDKYPLAFDNAYLNGEDCTFLYEWTSPKNIIILYEHDEPTLTLIGVIENDSAKYWSQRQIDLFLFNHDRLNTLLRPEKIIFSTIEECREAVLPWVGKEGVVIYSPNGQTLKKIKATEYCDRHRLASSMTGINGVLDSFMNAPVKFTSAQEFFEHVNANEDYEIADRCKVHMENVIDSYNLVLKDIKKAHEYVDKFIYDDMLMPEVAEIILGGVLPNRLKGYAFSYIHGKPIEDIMIKKAIKENIK